MEFKTISHHSQEEQRVNDSAIIFEFIGLGSQELREAVELECARKASGTLLNCNSMKHELAQLARPAIGTRTATVGSQHAYVKNQRKSRYEARRAMLAGGGGLRSSKAVRG
jgi:hypothetical protein